MLKLKVIMNSGVEEIFAAKCYAIPDANLEIILTNVSSSPVTVAGHFSLTGAKRTEALNLFPQGERTLAPGESASYYSTMDPDRWAGYRKITITDTNGHMHAFEIHHKTD
jgi:hypothetical protein